jgi:hypothetical protein
MAPSGQELRAERYIRRDLGEDATEIIHFACIARYKQADAALKQRGDEGLRMGYSRWLEEMTASQWGGGTGGVLERPITSVAQAPR